METVYRRLMRDNTYNRACVYKYKYEYGYFSKGRRLTKSTMLIN